MAWKSHGTNQKSLVEALKVNELIKSSKVENALLKVDRKMYCRIDPYQDKPQKIGFGATISAPHMHAMALELGADILKEGAKVLDVGSGSGYLSACFAALVGLTGQVIAMEHVPELAELSIKNILSDDAELLASGRLVVVVGDGRQGHPSKGPYDLIHVGAAAETVHPQLTQQLKPGGRLLIPVGARFQSQKYLRIDKKLNGELETRDVMPVRFVPLTSLEAQMSGRSDVAWEYSGNGSMEMLVDDTLLHIFGYLSLKEWLVLELVSQRWNVLLKKQWRSLQQMELDELIGVAPMRFCEKLGPVAEPQYFTPRVSTRMIENMALRSGRNLRSLSSGCSFKLPMGSLEILAADFPRLETLDLSGTIMIWDNEDLDVSQEEMDERRVEMASEFGLGRVFCSLQTLKLEKCFDDSTLVYHANDTVDSILFKVFSSMPGLRNLSLCHDTILNGSCLLGLNTNMEFLDLSFCRRISPDTICLVFTSLPNLKHISIYSCHKLPGMCIQYLSTTLQSVDFSYCDSIDQINLQKFIKNHPNLNNVHLAHVNGLDDGVLGEISKLRGLEILVLSGYFKESQHEHPFDIVKGLKTICGVGSLKSVDMSKNDFVEDGCLVKMSRECPALEEVNVANVGEVSAIGLASLGRLRRLRRVDVSSNECVDHNVLLAIADGGALEYVNARFCPLIREQDLRNISHCWTNRETVFQIY